MTEWVAVGLCFFASVCVVVLNQRITRCERRVRHLEETQRPTMNPSSFQQLEQDRQARIAGRTAPVDRGGFQGRSFEGRGFEGGGRFGR